MAETQLTPQHITALKAEGSRRDLKRFIKEFWHIVEPTTPFQDGYHIDAICDHLTNINQIKRLLVNMPPRFGKSTLFCVMWFCWYWTSHPEARFIFSSYALQLSIRDSVRARRLIESELFQSYYGSVFKLTSDQNTKQKFENSRTGVRLATSIDGAVTGEGGDILCCDDPMNLQEAESKTSRDSVIRWFSTVFPSRLNDPKTGSMLLVSQRCHVDDVTGWLLKNDVANNWCKLILPLEAGKCKFVSTRFKDKRKPNELLCPERIPQKEADNLKSMLGKRAFESQYNQNPAPSDEQIFDTNLVHYYTDLPPNGFRIAAVDLAISQKGDYTVIAVADLFRDGNVFLVHLHRERMAGPKIVPTIKAIHEAYTPQIIYIEDVAFQRLIIDECRMQRLPVRGVRPEGDKVSRSVMLQCRLENGQFWLPQGKAYNPVIIDELSDFPNASHDDIVDTLSYLCAQANTLYRRIPDRSPEVTEQQKREQEQAEFMRRGKVDEERRRKAIFEGLV